MRARTFAQDWGITESEYNKRYDRYRQEQRFFDNKLKQLAKVDDEYYTQVTYLVEIAKRSGELFRSSIAEEKRQLLALVLSNLQIKGKKVLYTLQKPFDTIYDCANSLSWGSLRERVRTLLGSYPTYVYA